jgi:hypothetical protein
MYNNTKRNFYNLSKKKKKNIKKKIKYNIKSYKGGGGTQASFVWLLIFFVPIIVAIIVVSHGTAAAAAVGAHHAGILPGVATPTKMTLGMIAGSQKKKYKSLKGGTNDYTGDGIKNKSNTDDMGYTSNMRILMSLMRSLKGSDTYMEILTSLINKLKHHNLFQKCQGVVHEIASIEDNATIEGTLDEFIKQNIIEGDIKDYIEENLGKNTDNITSNISLKLKFNFILFIYAVNKNEDSKMDEHIGKIPVSVSSKINELKFELAEEKMINNIIMQFYNQLKKISGTEEIVEQFDKFKCENICQYGSTGKFNLVDKQKAYLGHEWSLKTRSKSRRCTQGGIFKTCKSYRDSGGEGNNESNIDAFDFSNYIKLTEIRSNTFGRTQGRYFYIKKRDNGGYLLYKLKLISKKKDTDDIDTFFNNESQRGNEESRRVAAADKNIRYFIDKGEISIEEFDIEDISDVNDIITFHLKDGLNKRDIKIKKDHKYLNPLRPLNLKNFKANIDQFQNDIINRKIFDFYSENGVMDKGALRESLVSLHNSELQKRIVKKVMKDKFPEVPMPLNVNGFLMVFPEMEKKVREEREREFSNYNERKETMRKEEEKRMEKERNEAKERMEASRNYRCRGMSQEDIDRWGCGGVKRRRRKSRRTNKNKRRQTRRR